MPRRAAPRALLAALLLLTHANELEYGRAFAAVMVCRSLGVLLLPLLGGVLYDRFGFAAPFVPTAAALLLVGLLAAGVLSQVDDASRRVQVNEDIMDVINIQPVVALGVVNLCLLSAVAFVDPIWQQWVGTAPLMCVLDGLEARLTDWTRLDST